MRNLFSKYASWWKLTDEELRQADEEEAEMNKQQYEMDVKEFEAAKKDYEKNPGYFSRKRFDLARNTLAMWHC